MTSVEAALDAYDDTQRASDPKGYIEFYFASEDAMRAAIRAYLEAEAQIREDDPMFGPHDIRTLLLRRLAADVSGRSGREPG